MTTDQRIECLERKRADLKAKVSAESARSFPDELALRRWKREKVQLKDEIASLRGRANASSAA